MKNIEYAELTAFVTVASQGSFAKAASLLQLSTPTLSQRVSSLEQRLNVRLFNRTTRSVALTSAGEALRQEILPAMNTLDSALRRVSATAGQPAGTLRVHASSLAADLVLAPKLAQFHARFPEVKVDLGVSQEVLDIVAQKFDCGIRAGHTIDQDMVSARLTAPSRMIVAASPEYVAKHGEPEKPSDLQQHECLMLRQSSGEVLPWRFDNEGREIRTSIDAAMVSNNLSMLLTGAKQGMGLIFTHEDYLVAPINAGELVQVMPKYWRTFDGFYIYFPSHRQVPAALRALIDFLKGA